MDGMENYGNFAPPPDNPVMDRITAILQKRAQPIEMSPDQQIHAGNAAIYGAASGNGQDYSQIVNDWRAPQLAAQDRELESAKGAYDMFEMKRQAGDKNLQAIYDQISKITSDPMAQAKLIDAMHNDPEPITPQNALMKAARYTKELGIPTDFQRTEEKRKADLAATNALATQRGLGGGGRGGNSVFAQTMSAIESDPELAKLPTATKIRMAQNRISTDVTIDDVGKSVAMQGAADALGQIASGKELGGKIGGSLGEALVEKKTKAEEAQQSLFANTEARKLLDQGMVTGMGANWRLGFGKGLQLAGVNLSPDATANTEAFVAQRAEEVGRRIKAFGAGTGLSDADREYAEKAAAGKITLNEASLRKILDMSDVSAKNVIKLYHDELSRVPDAVKPYDMTVPAVGGNTSPAGIPDGAQQIGTKNGKPVYRLPDGSGWIPD